MLQKLSQATALVSQETPAIPIRRKQTKNSWPHMHALVYREESHLMTNNQWGEAGNNQEVRLLIHHIKPKGIVRPMHISLAIRAVAFPYHHSKKKKNPKKRSFPVQLRSSVEGSVSSKKLGIVDEVLSSQFCLAAASRVFGQISKIKKGYKLKRSGYVCECSFRLSTVERYPVSLQSPPSGTGTSEWMKQAQMSGYPFAASSR